MRNPINVLNSLSEHSQNSNYKFERLYRILFNEEMYYIAYQKIYPKKGSLTSGVDRVSIDGMSINRIKQIISSLKDEMYQPVPSQRVYIPKKNGKKRPLGIPSGNDKLIQEVVRMILEAIYEGAFDNNSHGFRPNRSCHTALISIQKSFTGAKWFIEGDIAGFFDNINHDILINILRERIADERFLRLIRKFLNAGYLEEWIYHKTYSGTPQGGVISPVLANIYLDKLDKYVKEYITEFNKGKSRQKDKMYAKISSRRFYLIGKLEVETDYAKRMELLSEIKTLDLRRREIPSAVAMDENYKRMQYKRYADDFIIGVIGSKDDCKIIKEDITIFLREKLKLELSENKTLITNAQKPAKFLGYDIFVRKTNDMIKDSKGIARRNLNGQIVLNVSFDKMRDKLISYDALTFRIVNGKEVWKAKSRPYMRNNDDLEIIQQYNSEIRGFYNYYSIANNCYMIKNFGYIMKYSMYKTYAAKYNVPKSKIFRKYFKNGKFAIPYVTKKGETHY